MRAKTRNVFFGLVLAIGCSMSDVASALTLQCLYGTAPGNLPGATDPTLFSKMSFSAGESTVADAIYHETRAWDPSNTYLGNIWWDVPMSYGGDWYHVLTLGSPYAVGTYNLVSFAYDFYWLVFEGVAYKVQVGALFSCDRTGPIPG